MGFSQKIFPRRNTGGKSITGKVRVIEGQRTSILLTFSKELLNSFNEESFNLRYGEDEDRGKILLEFSREGVFKWKTHAYIPLPEWIKEQKTNKAVQFSWDYDKDDNCIYFTIPSNLLKE